MLNPQTSAKVLGKADTVNELYRLLDQATREVWLISPFARLGKLRDLGRKIAAALDRKVKVSLIVRIRDSTVSKWDSSDVAEVSALMKRGLQVFAISDLHAKVYFSETAALVTSLNLVDHSFNNSIEVGMLLPRKSEEYVHLLSQLKLEVKNHMRPVEDLSEFSADQARSSSSPSQAPSKAPSQLRRKRTRTQDDFVLDGDDEDDDEDDDDEDACYRCGRPGHWADDCYARTSIDGEELDDDDDGW